MAVEKGDAQAVPVMGGYEGYGEAQKASAVQAEHGATIPCIAGKYDVLECLGRGSQGEVYRARRRLDGADVAIKVMHIKSVKNWKMYELFDREAKILPTIDIDGVAKFYEAIEDLESADPVSVIVQQFVDGHALSEFIKAHHRFLLTDIADILIQLTKILDELHKSDPPIIHRDIKPSNVMLQDSAHGFKVWLIDFGAVANPQVKDGGSTLAGTYGYMAPEQLMGQAKPESDLYSMAVMAFYLLTGIPPESLEIQDFRLIIDPHLQNLPFPVTVFLRQMLEPHIDQRLTRVETILQGFELIKSNDYSGLEKLVSEGGCAPKVNVDWTPMSSYKQRGCIEQWDALSDVVPRQIPSEALKHIKRGLRFWSQTGIRESPREVLFRRKQVIQSLYLKVLTAFGCSFVLVAFVGITLFREFGMQQFSQIEVYIGSFLISVVVTLISYIIMKVLRWKNYSKMYSKVRLLLSEGRKTFATVTSIDFESLVEVPSNDYIPLWKVSYAFNPVDDASDFDLIRYFYTRRKPSDLKVGDLIPCIYIIGWGLGRDEYVYSMPWPLLEQDDIYLSGDVNRMTMDCCDIVGDDIIKRG